MMPPLSYGILAVEALPPSALQVDMAAYWKLEEASGTRVDISGANDLTDNGSVGQAAGIAGQAAAFGGSNYLSINNNAELQTGGADFSFSLWAYMSSTGANQTILSKGVWSGASSAYEFGLFFASNTFQLIVSNGGVAITGPAISQSVWNHIYFYYDHSALEYGLRVNNAVTTVRGTLTSHVSTTDPFTIGANELGNFKLTGRVDEVGFWKRLLTGSEVAWLHNLGAGRSWANIRAYTGAYEAGLFASNTLSVTRTLD